MKVTFIVPRFHTNLYYRAKALQSAGYEVDVLAWRSESSECHEDIKPYVIGAAPGYRLFSFLFHKIFGSKYKNILKLNLFTPCWGKLYRRLKTTRPEMVFVRNVFGLNTIITVWLAKFFSQQVYVLEQPQENFTKNIKKKIMFFLLKKLGVKKFVSPIDFQYQDSFTYIPFTIPVEDFDKKYFKDGQINIFSIGKYEARKDHILLLRALKDLKEKYPVKLTIVGEKVDTVVYQELVYYVMDNNMQDMVELRNNLEYKQVLSMYKHFDLFVLPSYAEPAAYSPVEAMANKLPVIVSDSCGTKCYIERAKNGFIFASHDKDDLRQAIENIIENRLNLELMGQTSFEIAKLNHSTEAYLNKFKKLT